MSEALMDVALERIRQTTEKGHTAERDDGYTEGDLASAAACYAAPFTVQRRDYVWGGYRWAWPWSGISAPRHDQTRRDQLVKAGALILAEIDRLDRLAARSHHADTNDDRG